MGQNGWIISREREGMMSWAIYVKPGKPGRPGEIVSDQHKRCI
jgi:hypothetical protein